MLAAAQNSAEDWPRDLAQGRATANKRTCFREGLTRNINGRTKRWAGPPGVLGAQDLAGHTLHGLPGHAETEDGHGLPLLVIQGRQRAVVHGVHQLARVLQRAPLADAVGAAHPAGVQQPGMAAVLLQLGSQHLGIVVRVHGQERPAEARREGGLRLRDAYLGAGDLGGVAGDEMIHHLLLGEFGDGRQHPEGITGQEDHVAGVCVDLGRDQCIGDVVQGVGAPRVLRQGDVVVVDLAAPLIEDHVLQHTAEADGGIDLRLLLP